MKMILGTSFMAILVAVAFSFVVINRESEKIVNAAVPLALAAFGALALVVFAFAREEPMTRVFPVSFCYQVADKLPVTIPYRPFPWGSLTLVDRIRRQYPKVLNEPMDDQGTRLYHEFLQKVLIEWISLRHGGTWRMENLRFDTGFSEELFQPAPDFKQEASKVLSPEELRQVFGQNRFASVHTMHGRLALPPGTNLSIDTPSPKADCASGEIRFKNKFCEITLRTFPGNGMAGLGGYSMLLGQQLSSAQNHFWTQEYIVRVTATFSPFLVGHPRMRHIKQWATGILDGLQNAFDEQIIWRKAIENYMLRQHLPPPMNSPMMPFGPVQDQ